MLHYIGLDVSMKTTSICVIDSSGKVAFEETVPSDPITITSFIRNTHVDIALVALESGSISHWLTKELRKRDLPAICIDARQMSKILSININKTDKNDARLIADSVRCGFYSEVHLKDSCSVDLKILLNSRRTLINNSTQLKNTIRGHLKAFGIRLGTIGNTKFAPKVREVIKDKAEIVQIGLNALLVTFEGIQSELMKIDRLLKEMAKKNKDVTLLTTLPAIGIITAFTYLTYLGDPRKFKNSRTVGAYFGMTPKQYASGETQIQGKASKQGSSEVRSLLCEAGSVLIYRTKSWSKLKAWGTKLKKKKGHKKAILAVGRKLAVVMHRMLITGEPFKFGDEKTSEIKHNENNQEILKKSKKQLTGARG